MSDDKQGVLQEGSFSCNCADSNRRQLLAATTAVGGAVGLGAAVPFVASFLPSERAKAAGAPVEVDISALQPGELKVVEWRGKPVWILRRTKEMLESLKKAEPMLSDPHSTRSEQPAYIKGDARALKDEFLVLEGVCTHLGCSPSAKFKPGAESGIGEDWPGGFLCPCHGSRFDLAGRVFKSMPAPDNLRIPPHTYLSDTRLLIGEDTKGA